MSDLTINGCKCLNPSHKRDSTLLIGHEVKDEHTMNAFYNKADEEVTLQCHWCGYETTVDVGIRPLQLDRLISGEITLGPPAK